jgi:hypothetical protein
LRSSRNHSRTHRKPEAYEAGQVHQAWPPREPAVIGMLQILTYMFAFYLVVKGVEVLQVGLASSRASRVGPIVLGALTLGACILAAAAFVSMQDRQATASSGSMFGSASSDSTPTAPSSPGSPESQAEWARGRDARNRGWKWAEDRKLNTDRGCSQLTNTEEQTGCKAYVSTFGDRSR